MPSVKKGEKKSDFIKRCIPIVLNEGNTKDTSQASAICYSKWEEHKNKKKSKSENMMDSLAKEMLRKRR